MRQLDEDIKKRLLAAWDIIRGKKAEADAPHPAETKTGGDWFGKGKREPNDPVQQHAHGDLGIASTLMTIHNKRLAAARDLLDMNARHAKEYAEFSDKYGADEIGQLAPHMSVVSRGHKRLANGVSKVASAAKEEGALAGLTALRGLNRHVGKPIRKPPREKNKVEQLPKPMGTTKV
jgi:hypothetical protein